MCIRDRSDIHPHFRRLFAGFRPDAQGGKMGKIGAGTTEQEALHCAGAGEGESVIDPGVDVLFSRLEQGFIHRQDGIGNLHLV